MKKDTTKSAEQIVFEKLKALYINGVLLLELL